MTSAQTQTIAELSTNLAAGWLGVVFITPSFAGINTLPDFLSLLSRNLPPAIISIVAAVKLREEVKS